MKKKILGVLGGMGPAASARFYALLTEFTKAARDSEHIELLLHSFPAIPDRSDFIMKRSAISPLPVMKNAISRLTCQGAEIIAVPCNTAEYFHDDLQSDCPVPILRIAYESARFAAAHGVKKLGIIATDGTVHAGIYQRHLSALGLDFAVPSKETQNEISKLIYSSIKKALPAENGALSLAARELRAAGCDAAVLGCTELSLLPIFEKDNFFIDSLSVLAAKSVTACGYDLSEKGKIYKI